MKILVVDDDPLVHMTFRQVFKGDELACVSSAQEAEVKLKSENFGMAFLDIDLDDTSDRRGIGLLKKIRDLDDYLPCIMVSGHSETNVIEECLKLGATDYLVKGTVTPEVYRHILVKAQHWKMLSSQARAVSKSVPLKDGLDSILGESKAVVEMKSHISRLGKLPGPFLVTGETGTGKELVARSLWAAVGEPTRPFVAVNCASLPENLIESELFGFEKGAFTGANQTRTGLFEAASGGDVFLDEIGELTLEMQSKFLRVLQEKKVRRLGSDRERPVDVRIIAATNRDLKNAVKNGEFRDDLYYRLNVHQVKLPRLKERGEDILILFQTFMKQNGFLKFKFGSEIKSALMDFEWPGNIRQLRGFCESLRGFMDPSDLEIPMSFVKSYMDEHQVKDTEELAKPLGRNPKDDLQQAMKTNQPLNIVRDLEDLQKAYVKEALVLTQNNRSKAASLLGVSRQRMSNWMNEWEMNQ